MSKNIEIGNLYDLNKDIMKETLPLASQEIEDKQTDLWKYIDRNNNTYYMLLCNEQRDYTVFRYVSSAKGAAAEIIECLKNRGKILAIDYIKETNAYECWIKRSGMCFMYVLFPYDAAVIEC